MLFQVPTTFRERFHSLGVCLAPRMVSDQALAACQRSSPLQQQQRGWASRPGFPSVHAVQAPAARRRASNYTSALTPGLPHDTCCLTHSDRRVISTCKRVCKVWGTQFSYSKGILGGEKIPLFSNSAYICFIVLLCFSFYPAFKSSVRNHTMPCNVPVMEPSRATPQGWPWGFRTQCPAVSSQDAPRVFKIVLEIACFFLCHRRCS